VKSLSSLIRLVKWRIDEKRRELMERESEADAIRTRLKEGEEEIMAEQRAAKADFEAHLGYGAYARRAIKRRETLTKALAEADAVVETVRAELAELFLEQKQYEITQANRDRRERERLAKIEQAELDEIALNQHKAKKVDAGG
jgi:flagellar export protein FliJ